MIERQNTLNQLPSNDLADLNDNTIIVDEFVNSQNDFTANRFGSKFKTLHKIVTDINKLSDEISVGALPATRIVKNDVPTYSVGDHVEFEKVPTVNGKSVLKTGDAIQTFGDLSTTINLNELTGSNEGIYYQGRNTSAVTERGYPINQAGTLQVFKNGADGAGCCQIYTTYRNARQFIRNYRGGTKTWEEWSEVITTANSTVDSNGFLKKASPILRLFANNNIEEVGGFKKSGCALVNDFAYGVTATRIDVGHYEIHGSLGFAKRGWYITLPEDANGNKKFFAEYSVDENNIITVKTYTKKFDFESCQIVAGKPIDITDGRWVDVRLEMPVIEVIENEEPIPSTLNPVIVSEVPDDI